MSEPIETLTLDPVKEEEQSLSNAMGASVLEYESTMPTRFMVGTEHGVVFSCNRKGKTAQEKLTFRYNAHLGPVLALQRNPAFVKNFLTVGDWTAKIWSEDCRESAIMWTNFHKARLTDGAWSPTRLSVFFTTRSDGILDVWDVLQQQKQACLSVKVCDEPLKCLRTHEMGRIVAVGNQKGSTYLVEFSENLSVSNKNDKLLLTAMFEREGKREKILEARNRELRLKQKTQKSNLQLEQDSKMAHPTEIVFTDSFVVQAEKEFYDTIAAETKVKEDEVEVVDETELGAEEVEEPAPPATPEPVPEFTPAQTKKKGKGKKKKKK